ncbi:hypothetical protein HYC85_016513 [Camellia sinensis]|uniref:Uncharacterized protein n=1 Tax=Camellia sinensis TaxID=4442 RepID=A0A7J7H190_CAMSI|nr:hypothetical protein HYC85_016513 [Camellia sinensis]
MADWRFHGRNRPARPPLPLSPATSLSISDDFATIASLSSSLFFFFFTSVHQTHTYIKTSYLLHFLIHSHKNQIPNKPNSNSITKTMSLIHRSCFIVNGVQRMRTQITSGAVIANDKSESLLHTTLISSASVACPISVVTLLFRRHLIP